MSSASLGVSPATRSLVGSDFWLVGALHLRRTANGFLDECAHELPPAARANVHGAGPFCFFGLPAAPKAAGVYAIFVGGDLCYIGECQDLAGRFSARGYGAIHPRNCHHDGQSTNCKINARVLGAAKTGKTARVWFCPSDERKTLESHLIAHFSPSWNGRTGDPGRSHDPPTSPRRRVSGRSEAPTRDAPRKKDFEKALAGILAETQDRDETSIQIRAGDLHARVGHYPGSDHRMPSCCSAMRSLMTGRDRFVYQPPRGDGARLTIEYRLPRPARASRSGF
jgi:hypothetical protein